MTINGRRLAGAAYSRLSDDLSKMQREYVILNLVEQTFGKLAVPTSHIVRGTGHDNISKSAEKIARQRSFLTERINEITDELKAMEPVFAEAERGDVEAFADFIRERQPPNRAPGGGRQ